LIYGAADLGTELATGRGISERIGEGVGEAVGNLLFPGAQSQPAFTEAETLQDLVGQAPASTTDSFDQSAVRSGRSRAGEGGQDALGDFLSSFEFQGRRGQRTGDSSVVQNPSTLPPAAQSFFGQAPASNPAEAAQRLIDAGPAFTQAPAQAPALDPTSDEAILARRAGRESQFDPRGPNAPMGPEETRARLGGMTLNEYLNAPAGTPGVSGLRTDPQGRMITPSAQPPVDSAVPTAVAQPPVDALSSFERDSLARQQRIGGTGSFAGDSAAREARLAERDRLPGETQTERDTRIAQSRTTGGQTEGLSFDDARRRAEGQLAARGIINPPASQVNDLARSIQAAEPERLAELETKRAKDAADLRDAEAKKDFKPQVVEIGGQKLIQLSPNYYQPVRPEPTAEDPFEPRVLEEGGFTYYEVAPNRFERQPKDTTSTTEETSGLIPMDGEAPVATETTPTVPNDIKDYPSVEAAEAANLAVGTRITVQGKPAIIE
jgi:hypothetical protein